MTGDYVLMTSSSGSNGSILKTLFIIPHGGINVGKGRSFTGVGKQFGFSIYLGNNFVLRKPQNFSSSICEIKCLPPLNKTLYAI